MHPRTLKELRDQHVVKQKTDYSCGAAALATLLRYYFGEDTSEDEILKLLGDSLTEEEKRRKKLQGFSWLNLKQVAEQKGYVAEGVRLTIVQLAVVDVPMIVFLEPLGYKHFAVYRGMDRGRVYIADPARGNLRMSIGRFLDEWNGVVLALGRDEEPETGRHVLSVPPQWYVQPETVRLNGQLDLGTMVRTLPQR